MHLGPSSAVSTCTPSRQVLLTDTWSLDSCNNFAWILRGGLAEDQTLFSGRSARHCGRYVRPSPCVRWFPYRWFWLLLPQRLIGLKVRVQTAEMSTIPFFRLGKESPPAVLLLPDAARWGLPVIVTEWHNDVYPGSMTIVRCCGKMLGTWLALHWTKLEYTILA